MASEATEKAIKLTTDINETVKHICELMNGDEILYVDPEMARTMLLSIYVDIDKLKAAMKPQVELYLRSLVK